MSADKVASPEGGAGDERLKWFLKVIEGAGGEVCSTESRHNPINVFCEDRDNGDDTFNISEAAGYTQTSHDTSFDTSTTWITDKGRAYLSALATREEAPAEAVEAREVEAWIKRALIYIDQCVGAGEIHFPGIEDGPADLAAKGFALFGLEDDCDAAAIPTAALRAQPQARDEQPVYALEVARDPTVEGAKRFVGVTHPAPDALRVAVEALEPFAKGGHYRTMPGLSPSYTVADFGDGVVVTVADFRRASDALDVLQAEQKGGA